MRTVTLALVVFLASCGGGSFEVNDSGDVETDTDTDTDSDTDADTDTDTDTDADFSFSSPAFAHNTAIPSEYTCDGPGGWTAQNNPELVWANAPVGTQSFAMIYVDTDFNDWRHWAFFTSDATLSGIAKATSNTNTLPSSVTELESGDRRIGYVPNCPSGQSHRYEFTLWALDTQDLGLTGNATFAQLESAANDHSLGTVSFIGISDAGR
ncbi:MAG: YbhB/YbcL family Raf kinase inhibitor-like protein [Proteobacteria bacterium]|nr:YbhB/YbcL family Raf kinase inhibitor-like protein [Pseudomonadota bacterium]